MTEFQLYRCTECGEVSVCIGRIHSHIERKHGYFGWLRIPFTKTSPGNVEELMKHTDVIEVSEYQSFPATDTEITNDGDIDI